MLERSLQMGPDHRTGSRLGGAGGGEGAGKGRGGGGVRVAGRGMGREDPPGGLFQEGLWSQAVSSGLRGRGAGLGSSPGWRLGEVQPRLHEVGDVFSCCTWHAAPHPGHLPLPAAARTLHGLWTGEPGLALLCSPRAPGLWELPVPSGRQNLTR